MIGAVLGWRHAASSVAAPFAGEFSVVIGAKSRKGTVACRAGFFSDSHFLFSRPAFGVVRACAGR